MQTLDKPQKAHWMEKVLRLAIPAALIWGGIKLFNYMAPTIEEFLTNIWVILGLGVPLAMILLYALKNPKFLWMSYTNLCRKVTGFFIKLDFLSYMDSYVDTLIEKLSNLRKSKQFLVGKKVKLQGQIDKLIDGIDENLKKAKAAKDLGNKQLMEHHSSLAAGDKQSLEVYMPMLKKMEANITFLDRLETNWSLGIDKLKHEVSRMRTQYETMSEMAKAVGQAEEFANGNTEEAKIYRMSVNAFEESLSQKIAAIDEFEKNSKNIMQSLDLERQMTANEGADLLDQYMANGSSLFLPESDADLKQFSSVDLSYTGDRVKVPASKGNSASNSNEFSNLLK